MATSDELDYRFTLANERTLLAWLRTALALFAAGVGVAELVPEFGFTGARRGVGIALALVGIWVAGAGVRRWRRVQAAMERGEELPRSRMPVVLGTALAVLGLAVAVLLALSAAAG